MDGFGTIAFGVRTGKPDPVFLRCWTHLLSCGKDNGGLRLGDTVLVPSVGLPHHHAGNELVHQFHKHTKCDTLMLLDDDMDFTPQMISNMRDHVANWSFDVVQGLCCSRKPPHAPIMLADTPNGRYQPLRPTAECGTYPVGMVGLAFTLIRRKALDAVEPLLETRGMFFAWGGNGLGEDATFCELAKKAGQRLGIDAKVPVGHRCAVSLSYDVANAKTQMQAEQHPFFMDLLAYMDGAE